MGGAFRHQSKFLSSGVTIPKSALVAWYGQVRSLLVQVPGNRSRDSNEVLKLADFSRQIHFYGLRVSRQSVPHFPQRFAGLAETIRAWVLVNLRQLEWRRREDPFDEDSDPGGSRNGSTEMRS